jgi:hypothetical protein
MSEYLFVEGKGNYRVIEVDVGRSEPWKVAVPWAGGMTSPKVISPEVFKRDYIEEAPAGPDFDEDIASARLEAELKARGWYGSDALDDLPMREVISLQMRDPDKYQNEDGTANALLQSLVQQTTWFQNVTKAQDDWRDPSMRAAERQQRISDAARSLLTLWRQYTGIDIDTAELDLDNDGIITQEELKASVNVPEGFEEWALKVASGVNSSLAAIESLILPEARKYATSPFMRSLEQLEREAGAPAVSRATKRGEARSLRERYGLDTSKENLLKMGEDLYMNATSLEDLEQQAQTEAESLYPHMPKGTDFTTYSSPYATSFMKILELPQPAYNDPMMRRFLGGAELPTLGAWEDELRGDGRYEETDGYRRSLFSSLGGVGQTLGFN